MMREMNYEQLNMELRKRGIVYDAPDMPDQYEQCCYLEGIYSWGFTVITYCNVLDPVITFYDTEYQAILSLDHDNYTQYTLQNGRLFVEETMCFSEKTHKYGVNLNDGAPVHVRDIEAIGYVVADLSHDRRFYALKDGRMYFKEDGEALKQLKDVSIENLTKMGFKIIEPENYGANIDILNDLISKKY